MRWSQYEPTTKSQLLAALSALRGNMKLHDIIRKEEIEEKFDKKVTFKQFGVDGINDIACIDPNILFEIGAQAWMLYCQSSVQS